MKLFTISSNFRLIMDDMHGNSPKTLRQDLLRQRKEFAAGQIYAQTKDLLIASLNQFLTEDANSRRVIALYSR
jgi:hypothetical protein